jgi:putative FmdB family regulatory protein
MPLYEYECKKCHRRIEKIQSFAARHIKKCPTCGGVLEQVVSAPAVQFKGSGWYVTDYAKKSSAAASSSSSDGDSDSKSDSGSKGEAAKSDASKGDSDSKSEKKDSKPKAESKESRKSEKK